MSDAGDSLQDEFDVIVLGTGVTESIVAAACARAGKSVLHIDPNDYYGSDWASFWFNSWNDWLDRHCSNKEDTLYHNIEKINYIADKREDSSKWSIEKLNQLSNKFAIDLTPRLIYSDGPMTQLLLQSNICRYLSFKECTHFLLACPGESIELREIPCTRSDVFNDRTLSLLQKRKLMKFIDEFEKISSHSEVDLEEPFEKFLSKHSLDPLLVNVIKCVSLSQADSTVGDAVKKLNLFTKSAGRYGKTPFLWPMYGSGELPQAFCRLCAVFGGFYCLKCDVLDATYVKVTKDENTEAQVTTQEEQREEREQQHEQTHDQSGNSGHQWKIKVKLKSHSTMSASGSCDEKSVSCKYLVSSVQCSSKKFLKQLHKQWQEEVKKAMEEHKKDQTVTMEGGIMGLQEGEGEEKGERKGEKEKGEDEKENEGGKREEEEEEKSEKQVNSSHVVCLTTKSIRKADESGNQVTFALFPAGFYGSDIQLISDVTLIQLSPSTSTVPSGLYLVYGTCTNGSSDRSARQLLEPLINKLFTLPSTQEGSSIPCEESKSKSSTPLVQEAEEDEHGKTKKKKEEEEGEEEAKQHEEEEEDKGEIVSCYFFDKRLHPDDSQLLRYEANQLFVLYPPRPDQLIDYESPIQQARRVFTTMFPDCDFLAKAPDSEDIIFDDGHVASSQDSGT